jgi:hypothetical protein
MSLRDSESDFGGRLGASLTPRVPGARVREPGEQNSGLVDIRALYAASVEQVMQRAQAARAWPPVVAFDLVAFDPVAVDEEPVVLPRRRLGWLPITAVLLVLATTGSLFVASSNVPAVMHAKTTLVPAAMRAKATIVGVAMRAEAAVVARVDRLTGRPLPVAAPVGVQPPEAPPVTPAPPPVAPALLAPPASQVGEAAPPMTVVDANAAPASAPPARAPVTRGHALPKAAADIRSTTRAPKHPGSANPPATAATPAEAPEPATVKAAPEPAKVPAPAAGGADAKPMSLDDMIRRAVETESKRKQ